MSNELLIEAGACETRVAVLESGRVVELYAERSGEEPRVGDIFKGRVSRHLPGIQAAFVDIGGERNAYLFAGDGRRSGSEEELRQGQEVLVQVAKEPAPGKGARITSQPSLPGRFVVYLPGGSGVGVSRQIVDSCLRERFEAQLPDELEEDEGLIVRTAAVGRSVDDLRSELNSLRAAWHEIEQLARGRRAPFRLHRELELARRSVRDLLGPGDGGIWVEGTVAWQRIASYLEAVDPQSRHRLRSQGEAVDLFSRFGAERAWSQALRRRVWLKSGGFVVIDSAEALVAIDVNTGRHTEGAELESTSRTTNLEAAEEIGRQIRLRDLSGIIVIDFIDMAEDRHRQELLQTLQATLEPDRLRTQLSTMSDFGLVALTRKRVRGDLMQQLTDPCPCCGGRGRMLSALTLGIEIGRALRRQRQTGSQRRIVEVHPRVKRALEREHPDVLAALQEEAGAEVVLQPNADLAVERYVLRAAGSPDPV